MRPTPGKNRANPQTFGLTGHGSGSLSLFEISSPLSNRTNCLMLQSPKAGGGWFFPSECEGKKNHPPLAFVVNHKRCGGFKDFFYLQILRS